MKIFGDSGSGNCYKIKLLAALLEIQHEWIHVDILAGGTQTPEFLNKNPNGKIPVVELADGRCLSESNAIINFLASGSSLVSSDRYEYAKVQQWQFFEQYSHEPFIAFRPSPWRGSLRSVRAYPMTVGPSMNPSRKGVTERCESWKICYSRRLI